jgi:hypothetical protein
VDTTSLKVESQKAQLEPSDKLKLQLAGLQAQMATWQSQKALLESLGRESLALSEPEAKIVKTKDGFLPAYNVQTTVDNDSHFITTCEVTDYANDYHCLKENVETLTEQLGIAPRIVLADAGYANEEDIQALEKKLRVTSPFRTSPNSKRFSATKAFRLPTMHPPTASAACREKAFYL